MWRAREGKAISTSLKIVLMFHPSTYRSVFAMIFENYEAKISFCVFVSISGSRLGI
jgi:hypothetical protein